MAVYRVIKQIPSQEVPMALLLEADPSEACIQKYLNDSWCFGLFVESTLIAICVIKQVGPHKAELFNIAVKPDVQGQGYGAELLSYVLDAVEKKGMLEVELGTGSFGYQLSFYQKHGFRVDAIWTDFFITHYPDPIYEHGIQHKDMLRLVYRITLSNA